MFAKSKIWQSSGTLTLATEMISFVMLITIAVQTVAQHTNGPIITTFDAPGAGMHAGQGAIPESINSSGEIAGYYYDENDVVHGFLRAVDDTVTTFDVPGASPGLGQGTYPYSMNSRGEITGWFYGETAGTLGMQPNQMSTSYLLPFDAIQRFPKTAGKVLP